MSDTPLLSTREAATRLGVTPRRVVALIRAGRLPALRVGHTWIIREADLELVKDRRPGRPRS
jgi:excisionase family DNA binding protein